MQRWDRFPFQDAWPFSALWGKETPLGILAREQSCHCEAQSYMAYLVLCLFLFSLSKCLQGFFSPHLKNYYATASCWDYTNKLIIAKQYAAPCSNITARQQSSPRCQLPFTACKQKRHKWRPPTLPASGGQSCWQCGPRVEFLSSLTSALCVQWGRAKSCSSAKQLSAIRMHHFLGVG